MTQPAIAKVFTSGNSQAIRLIAAHARSLDACLVTNNTREFGRVAGLQVEDWTLPPSNDQ